MLVKLKEMNVYTLWRIEDRDKRSGLTLRAETGEEGGTA